MISSRVTGLNRIVPSTRYRNSGRNDFRSSAITLSHTLSGIEQVAPGLLRATVCRNLFHPARSRVFAGIESA